MTPERIRRLNGMTFFHCRRPSRATLATAILVSALALVLQGCTGGPQPPGGRDLSAEPLLATAPTYPAPADIDPEMVTGARTMIRTSLAPRTHVTVPAVPGAAPLNAALAEQAARWEADFADEGPNSRAELSIGWQPVALSTPVVGIALDRYEFAGATGASTTRTFWYDASQQRVRPNTDLVADPDALARAIRTSVAALGITTDQDALDEVLQHGGPQYLGFTDDGQLLAGFADYQIAAGSYGSITVAVHDVALSAFGTQARFAAQNPTPTRPPSDTSPSPALRPATVDCRRRKCVALTFDDGPANYTDRLLDTLTRAHVRATFFVLGQQVDANPSQARRIVAEGHQIGNHSWSHRDLSALSEADRSREITRTTREVERVTGIVPQLLRPPYGATNAPVDLTAKRLDLPEILWDVDPLDWRDRDSRLVRARVLSHARRGSIILMHDIHRTSVDAVPAIIAGLRSRGFTLVTVSELLGAHLTPGKRYSRALR